LTPSSDTSIFEALRQSFASGQEFGLARTAILEYEKTVLRQEKAALEQTLRASEQAYGNLEEKYEKALRDVKDYFNKLFRPRSEKLNENQMELIFEALLDLGFTPAQNEVIEEEVFKKPRRTKKTRRPGGREALPAHLPVERIEHKLPEGSCCSSCGSGLTWIRDETSEQLEFVPASFKKLVHVRGVYACRSCEETMAIAPKVQKALDKGLPGPGLLAHVMVSKFADHLPLYRQSHIAARHGVDLSRSTLCDWVAAAADLVDPIYRFLWTDLLKSHVIQTDGTGVKVLKAGPGSQNAHLWAYLGDRDHPHVLYDFTLTKEAQGPLKFLKGFQGQYLQADAAAGYDAFFTPGRGLKEVGCLSHGRRYFFDAATKAGDKRAYSGLALINKLFEIEQELKDLSDDERATQRKSRAGPVFDKFQEWLESIRHQALPKSALGKAVGYATRQGHALRQYLEDGRLQIDNNASERALRVIALGRKNWLFAGSPEGGRRAAKLFSLIESAKRLGLEPFVYLRDVFTRLPTTDASQIHELTPVGWAAMNH
jgi:transposase